MNQSSLSGYERHSRSNESFYLKLEGAIGESVVASVSGPSEAPWYVNHSANDTQVEAVDLEAVLGPRRRELYKVVPVTVIYCIIFISGIIGNVSTCIVISRNKYMQTATNYYLFNLAIADLLVLFLGLPLETYSFWSAYPWIFGETFCVIRTMAAETSTYACILTITAFTVERYVAICHPMWAQTMSSLKRAIKVIVLSWLISAVCSIPMVLQVGIVYVKDHHGNNILESALCNVDQHKTLEHAFEISTFLFFLTPMTIITVLYGLIGYAIRRSTLSRAGSDTSTHSQQTGTELRAQQQARARRAVLKMLESAFFLRHVASRVSTCDRPANQSSACSSTNPLLRHSGNKDKDRDRGLSVAVAVVVAFFICWAPFHLQRLMVIYIKQKNWTPALYMTFNVLYYISGILYYVSSTINPILYNIMSLKFRQAFRNTIFKPCRKDKIKKRKKKQARQRYYNKAYKFNNRPLTDTHLTLVHGNPYFNRLRRGVPYPNFLAGQTKSNSSSASGGSSARMLANEDPFDEIELDNIIECKSVSCNSPRTCAVNANFRPYHSYA